MLKTVKTLLIGLAAVAAIFLVASPVSAYNKWQSSWGFTYQGSNKLCVWDKSSVGTGPYGGGAMAGIGQSYYNNLGYCSTQDMPYYWPAGWLALDVVGYRWANNTWNKCADSGWMYSSGNAYQMTYSTIQPTNYAPCGAGYYAVVSNFWVWDGSAWRGGGMQSPSLWLPSNDPPRTSHPDNTSAPQLPAPAPLQ